MYRSFLTGLLSLLLASALWAQTAETRRIWPEIRRGGEGVVRIHCDTHLRNWNGQKLSFTCQLYRDGKKLEAGRKGYTATPSKSSVDWIDDPYELPLAPLEAELGPGNHLLTAEIVLSTPSGVLSTEHVDFLLPVAGNGVSLNEYAYHAPNRVGVYPVFLVSKGEAMPDRKLEEIAMRHLVWAQKKYRELLDGPTFRIACSKPPVIRSPMTMAERRTIPKEDPRPHFAEVLNFFKLTRWNCPYVLLIFLMNKKDGWPNAGARQINGGVNSGGGVIQASAWGLTNVPNTQSTLRHELGHSMGLTHVDTYGYDMKTNPSLMSYNPTHHTDHFKDADVPGILIPEDIRTLAKNDRALPGLTFDPDKDVPADYTLADLTWLIPIAIEGQPHQIVQVETNSGETYNSRAQHVVHTPVDRSSGPDVRFISNWGWHSGKVDRPALTVTFPTTLTLDRVRVHSQHSGKYHMAGGVTIEAETSSGQFRDVATRSLGSANADATFPATKARRWRFVFKKSNPKGMVVIRGLRFFYGQTELFPPPVVFGEGDR